ncbi:O-antigen ligase family protein [Gulosibacter chungangensis]|nr:O-antigen ligase family protein [Gulosibacter chungangensis]
MAFVLFTSSNPTIVSQSTLTIIVLLWFVLRMLSKGRRYDFRIGLPLALALFATTSVLWASNQTASVSGAFSLILYTVLAVHIVASIDIERAVLGISTGFKCIITASLATAVLSPSAAFVNDAYQGGAFEGIATHRNFMGYLLCLAALFFAYQAATRTTSRFRSALWFIVSFGMVLWTQSVTSAVMTILWSVVLWLTLRILRAPSKWQGIKVSSLILAATTAGIIAMLNFTDIAMQLGRDPTLTGRTRIWDAAITYVQSNPLIGEGWASVWGPDDPAGQAISSAIGFRAFHAHNGYLNTALQVGWIGLGILLLALIVAIAMLHRGAFSDGSKPAALGLIVLLAIASFDMVETRLTGSAGWLLLVVFYAYGSRMQRNRQEQFHHNSNKARTSRIAIRPRP